MELLIFVVFVVVFCSFPYVRKRKKYDKTEYAVQTQNSYKQVMNDKGLLGEFNIYKALERLKGPRKFLFNLYLPKWDGSTTELDVVLLHGSGIYVFESKNYGGWIFGSERQQYWTQTLPAGRGQSQKNRFYNPVLQNTTHLDMLYRLLRSEHFLNGTPPCYSYIVFSNHCEFKSVPKKCEDHYILHLKNLFRAVQKNIARAGVRLTAEEIDSLYQRFEPYAHPSDATKQAHIENIRLKYR